MANRNNPFLLLAFLLCSSLFVISEAQKNGPSGIIDGIKTYEVELPMNLSGTTRNWRIWGTDLLSTRLFPGVDSERNVYIGCSSSENNGYVFKVDPLNHTIIAQHSFPNHHVRGLYVHQDGSYGALLWNPKTYNISVAKVNSANQEVWRSELYHNYAVPDDFGIGDSRLEYGGGKYYAYYHVHGVGDFAEGHEGDAYFSVDDSGNVKNIWGWGCSHSMSNLLRFHPETNKTIAICDSDAYPGLGIFTENSNLIYNAPGNMGGSTAAELGGVEIGKNGTWILVFNALQPERNSKTYDKFKENQDIGLAFISSEKEKISVKFLTKTKKINEDDSCIVRLEDENRYLLGWKSGTDYLLSIINSEGKFVVKPVNVTDYTKWGNRDDSFRRFNDGSVAWLYAPNSYGNKVVVTEFVAPQSGASINVPFVYLLVALMFLL